MRVGQLVCVAALLSAAVAVGDDFQREGAGSARQLKNALEQKAPPALEVKNWRNVEGKGLSLDDLKGKVVVLDFWGTWCPPCRAAMPHLKELYHKHKDDGLVIIGVHTTRGGENMDDFVKEQGIDWPVAVDVDGKTVKAFQVDSFPDYYLIDRQGILRVADLVNGDLDRAVRILVKEPADIAAPEGK
jgi:thiol-disulfide isomerase/thioredoxin